MHIFLTGDVQIGKTTIIGKFLAQSGLSADGLITYWDISDAGGRTLYLSPYTNEPITAPRYCLARCPEKQLIREKNIQSIFDVHGSQILSGAGKCDIIIIDELGFLESESLLFQDAVLKRISGNIPILGVIKPKRTEFLNAVRSQPDVQICEVTKENRDHVSNWLWKQYFKF